MSEQNKNIEDQIMQLKLMTENYKKLSDEDKLDNIDTYNKIIQYKEKLTLDINKLKQLILDIDKQHHTGNNSDDKNIDYNYLLETINETKKIIDCNDINNLNIHELVKIYCELVKNKHVLESYFQEQKLKITKL